MRKLISAFMLSIILFSCVEISSSEEGSWWDDDFNYRVKIMPGDQSSSGTVSIDLGDLIDELGISLFDPEWDYDGRVDLESLRLVESGNETVPHEFNWKPGEQYFVDDFESGQVSWSVGTDMEAQLVPVADGSSMIFYKNTEAGVKMYATLPADSFKDMDYLMFYGKGSFKVALKDPGKGKYLVEEEINIKENELVAIPLSFANFREGVNYYLELIPLDLHSFNEIDNIKFISDTIIMDFAPSEDELYLYFNTYATESLSAPGLLSEISGQKVPASLASPEGFRVIFEERPSIISGTYEVKASVIDSRYAIDHVRYRIDYPSWVELESTDYGVWGEMTYDGSYWKADWDTIGTICDGNHTLTVFATDVTGATVLQTIEVEVDNVNGDGAAFAQGEDSFRFAVVGDTQPEFGGSLNPLVATLIMESIAKTEDIDFIIQVGDTCYAGHESEYAQVRRQLTAFANVPFYTVVGNHDAATADGLDNFESYFGDITYSFDYGNSHFIFLCSELDGQKGYVTGDQLEWLDDELSASANKEHVFIVVHQPIYPVFFGIENTEEVQEVIRRYENVTAIFQGHEHTYNHETVDGFDSFVTGGATWLDPQYAVENTFNHFFIIEVDGPDMTWEVIRTSQLFLEDPQDGIYTSEATIDVVGHTQPYAVVDVNGYEDVADARGEYSVNIPLEYGANSISASTSDLPDGVEHSVAISVFREFPLHIECPESIEEGKELVVKVTSTEGPVEGAMVSLIGDSKATGADGSVSFDGFPDGSFKVSAYLEGYQGTFEVVTAQGAAGGSYSHTMALAVIVVIALGALYSLIKRR